MPPGTGARCAARQLEEVIQKTNVEDEADDDLTDSHREIHPNSHTQDADVRENPTASEQMW